VADETGLTKAQRNMLTRLRNGGPRDYNGRHALPVEALEARGLVDATWDRSTGLFTAAARPTRRTETHPR
jgi:hypothetical protein